MKKCKCEKKGKIWGIIILHEDDCEQKKRRKK